MATYNIEITRHSDILAKLHALAAGENEYFKMRVKTKNAFVIIKLISLVVNSNTYIYCIYNVIIFFTIYRLNRETKYKKYKSITLVKKYVSKDVH